MLILEKYFAECHETNDLFARGCGYARLDPTPEEVGSYITSLQFLLCQQYVHRRECMGKNKHVARTKQNEGQGCFVSK